MSKDNLLELLLLPPGQIRFSPSGLVAQAFPTELSLQSPESLFLPLSLIASHILKTEMLSFSLKALLPCYFASFGKCDFQDCLRLCLLQWSRSAGAGHSYTSLLQPDIVVSVELWACSMLIKVSGPSQWRANPTDCCDGWWLPSQALFSSSPVGYRRNGKVVRSVSVPGEVWTIMVWIFSH